MKPPALLLASATLFAMTVIGAQADDTYYNQRNSAGYIIFEHYPTYEVRITRDSQNNYTREDVHYFAQAPLTLAARPVDVQADLSPFLKAAVNQTVTDRLAKTVATPAVVVGANIDTTESDRKAATERAKVEAAQHIRDVKAGRAFKNGE
jgi:hypothetical protein